MIENLVRANLDANRHARDSRDTPKVLELDVDCTDPYGRYEIDADGRGGNMPLDESTNVGNVSDLKQDGAGGPSITGANNNPKAVSTKLPLKRVTVFVATTPPVQNQQTVVLSAAVSSTKRILKDCRVAVIISKRLDAARGIPSELSCQAVLMNLFPTLVDDNGAINEGDGDNAKNKEMIANVLDVTIAYLRRVHLFTFYNGCTFSNNIGSVLGNSHPAGIVHLRLKGADEILKKAREENADMYDDLSMGDDDGNDDMRNKNQDDFNVKEDLNDDRTKGENTTHSTETKDMLVMRLDDSIEKILKIATVSMERSTPYIVNETVDALASEIESLEERAKREWIDNHSVVDGDGRARCSFHFCNKLFKDKNFLQKHLLKKHPEFLEAEKAKVHDSYMMDWWDKEICRPVPRVTIDCGPQFGLIVNPVKGGAHPTVNDPEPDLWREEQDRVRKREEEEERYRQKMAATESMEQNHRKNSESMGDGGDSTNVAHTAASNFVDIDDMKDEKVELSFDNVNVVTLTTSGNGKKKKKKKKKLL